MSDSPGLDPDLLALPSMRAALADRDITKVYKILVREGIPQRRIAELVGQSQSEVSEIIKGRQVSGYDLLVRIASGLGAPRGAMGLAYDGDSTEPAAEEVDEDVERRNFLAIAGAILFGAPVLGDPHPLTLRDVALAPPARVGPSDVTAFQETVARLNVLDREAGGMAAREALARRPRRGSLCCPLRPLATCTRSSATRSLRPIGSPGGQAAMSGWSTTAGTTCTRRWTSL
jgi:transcriptional regulator with XRE-family HTH domain